jgi:hypothetical protein
MSSKFPKFFLGEFLLDSSRTFFSLRLLNKGDRVSFGRFTPATDWFTAGFEMVLGVTEPSRLPMADLMSSSSGCLGNVHRDWVEGLRMVICSTSDCSLPFSASSFTFISV